MSLSAADISPILRDVPGAILRRIWSVLLALGCLEFLPEKWREPAGFALRSWSATMLALYAAFYLQLDQPYWAAMAVWMVTQPTPGMAISKAFYRIVGTLAGSAMGLILIAFFAQTPELFILALALWVAGCTIASNLLRNFRAYGTVLAGYTAAIVSLGAFSSPDSVFDIAMARGSATIIGILCTAMVTSLFAPHRAFDLVRVKFRQVIDNTARRCSMPMTASLEERVAIGRPLLEKMVALDAEIEFAAAESAQFRIHADGARSLLAHLFAVISARRSLEAHLMRVPEIGDRKVAGLLAESLDLLRELPEKMGSDRWEEVVREILALRTKLRNHSPENLELGLAEAVSSRLILDRLEDLLRHLGRAIHDWGWLHKGWRWEPSLRLNFHRDQRLAWINGTRAFLAVIAGGAFWIASAWSSGSLMLIQLSVACSLFSAAPRPDKAGMAFFWGGMIASVAAFICNFYFLVNLDGFPLLCLVYGLFLIPGALAFLNPKYSLMGLAYCVIFIATSRPLNPMNFDVVSFINNAVATEMGVWLGVLMYLLFMPPDPLAARRYVVWRIRLGLQNISYFEPMPPPSLWQTRMFDRVSRLNQADNPSGTPTDEWLDGGLGALNLGNDILRLRMLLADGKLSHSVAGMVRAVLKTFGELVANPYPAELVVRTVRDAMQQAEPEGEKEKRRAWLRTLGILQEMETFFIDHPRFLTP